MIGKIQAHHQEKLAYIYIRQSTMGQVQHHQESTERQYALKNKAQELGWAPERIRILDGDLGTSGAHMAGRSDFKTLVADVSMRQAGAVFALEASRLARSCADWHRLLELCSLTDTLIIDEDGCYHPADFNDQLLLGLKGTMSQAELHFLRARLQGGKLNKAKKGELRFPLPVGFCYDAEGNIVLDPDEEVRGAVQLVFATFRETGSAYAVVHRFVELGLRFPKRAYGGVWGGKLIWGRLTHGRVLGLLKNPSYAGAYVYGRYRRQMEIMPGGEIELRVAPTPIPEWLVRIQGHHDGYITWDDFVHNRERLEGNRTNGEAMVLSGPAREGLALLQGLLLCGRCGRRLTVRYVGNGGIYPTYQCNWMRREGEATTSCMTLRCDVVDGAVCDRALEVIKPAQIEIAIQALEEIQRREHGISRQREMRIERADYDAQLAQRRYEEVDPSNRLVAATLERRWNEALLRLEEIKQQYAEHQRTQAKAATPEQRNRILALAKDLPALWRASTTKAADRKRLLRLLIKDITIEKVPALREIVLHIRWQGGATEDLRASLPMPVSERVRYSPEIVSRVRELAVTHSDEEIAATLNQDGRLAAKGQAFTSTKIRWVRYVHDIAMPPQSKSADDYSVKEVAARLGVPRVVIYSWLRQGLLSARRANRGSPFTITMGSEKERELRVQITKRRSRAAASQKAVL